MRGKGGGLYQGLGRESDAFVKSGNMKRNWPNNWPNEAAHHWSAPLGGRQNEIKRWGKREWETSGVCWSLRRFTAVALTFTVPGRENHGSHFVAIQLWRVAAAQLCSLLMCEDLRLFEKSGAVGASNQSVLLPNQSRSVCSRCQVWLRKKVWLLSTTLHQVT